MKGAEKRSRFSRAPGGDPREDWTSKLSVEGQRHRQVKPPWVSHSNRVNCDSSSLTGYMNPFKGKSYLKPLKERISYIPQIKWKCPPKFALDYNWRVAAGEESDEVKTLKTREMRVFEAVSSHPSAIPPSPSMSLYLQDRPRDDISIPLIPINPIEEAAAAAAVNTSVNSQVLDLPQGSLTSEFLNTLHSNLPFSIKPPSATQKPALVDGDAEAAAAAALTAILKTKELGSLIDTDLLIQLLNNPKMIEKLTNEIGAAANTSGEPFSVPKPVTESVPVPSSKPDIMIRKSISDHGALANTRSAPSVNPLVPLASSKREVIKKSANEHGPPVSIAKTPISWSPAVPFTSSKPDETMVIKKLINEHAHIGTLHIAGSKPVVPLVPVPGSKSDVVVNKKMVNEYGAPANIGKEPISGSKSMTLMVPFSAPKPEMSVLPRPHLHPPANGLQSGLHVRSPSPVKDINYFKSLIKQHGEGIENVDHDHSQISKMNNSPGSEQVQNIKSNDSKTMYQKPCLYFDSPQGCPYGSSCQYEHDLPEWSWPGEVEEAPGAKRMKLGGEGDY